MKIVKVSEVKVPESILSVFRHIPLCDEKMGYFPAEDVRPETLIRAVSRTIEHATVLSVLSGQSYMPNGTVYQDKLFKSGKVPYKLFTDFEDINKYIFFTTRSVEELASQGVSVENILHSKVSDSIFDTVAVKRGDMVGELKTRYAELAYIYELHVTYETRMAFKIDNIDVNNIYIFKGE